MTILEINNYFYRRGGSETALFETIEVLEECGHRVASFAMADAKNEPSEYTSFFPESAPRWQFWKRFYNTDVARALERLIEEVQPDVAHLHNIAYHLTPAVITVLRRHHIPMVQTLHDYQAVSPLPLLFSRGKIYELQDRVSWIGVIVRRAVHRSFVASTVAVFASVLDLLFGWTRSVSRFLAPSLCAANIVSRYGLPEQHVRVVAQSVPEHLNCPKSQILNSKSQIPHSGSYFLFVGRLSPEKGVDLLLQSWSKLPPEHRLLIVGTGPAEVELRAEARRLGLENVLWFGATSDPAALAGLYEGAIALLVPSQWYENAPYVVLEAARHGVSSIASDIGGLPELVAESRGWLVRPEDPDAWSVTLRWVAEHSAEAKRRGAEAKVWASSERSRAQYGRQLERVFAEAVQCARVPKWCMVESASP